MTAPMGPWSCDQRQRPAARSLATVIAQDPMARARSAGPALRMEDQLFTTTQTQLTAGSLLPTSQAGAVVRHLPAECAAVTLPRTRRSEATREGGVPGTAPL